MFHVFVEGAADASPEGITRLANAMASKYGLPAAELRARLQAGRFRVKGNVDRATAVSYMRDLEILGARCAIEEANAANSMATPPAGVPVARPSTPPGGTPAARPSTPPAGTPAARPSTPNALADQPASRPSAPPSALAGMPRAATPAPVPGAYASGLSAAFSSDSSPATELGALESDGAPLSLSSVDGADSSQPNVIEKSPEPAFGVPASIGPAMAKPEKPGKPGKPARPKDEPLDMFAPPDANDAELAVDIADDEKDFSARKRASTPAAAVATVRAGSDPSIPPVVRPASEPASSSSSRLASQPAASDRRASQPAVTSLPSKLGPLANERVRTIAGVVLAILLGFIPAHFVAHSREASAYRDLDARLVSIQSSADTPEAWATLDKTRADFLDRKHEERRNIALMALAIWALVGGAIGYGWFKRVPWDEL